MKQLLRIERIAPGGEGVAQSGERPVFVPFTAPGDEVEVEVPEGEGAAHAALVAVQRAGPDRVTPPCVHFGIAGREPLPKVGHGTRREGEPDVQCGGCEWLHLAYEAQLRQKERAFFDALRRIAKLDPGPAARPILASPAPLRYRSRAKFHLDRASGRLAFFRRRSHEAVALRECHLLAPALDAFREQMGPALAAARLDLKDVALEWSEREATGAAYLRLAALPPGARARAEALLGEVTGLRGLVLQAEGSPPVLVGEPVLLQDRRPGQPEAGAQRSRPDVFSQANRGANAALVELAVSLARPDGEEVLELFCGAGNFTAALAARARMVHAVELQGPALELARRDLAAAPVRFYAGDSLAIARALSREKDRRFGAVLLDPPREGAKGIGPTLRDLKVPRAVYVSCDPATLARDVRACVEAGFEVAHVQPVDMFPQTHHVEGVVLLERAGR